MNISLFNTAPSKLASPFWLRVLRDLLFQIIPSDNCLSAAGREDREGIQAAPWASIITKFICIVFIDAGEMSEISTRRFPGIGVLRIANL
jgi:hypothetical protein